jgi:hypothetical protein
MKSKICASWIGFAAQGVFLPVKRSVKVNEYDRYSRAETSVLNSSGGIFGGMNE